MKLNLKTIDGLIANPPADVKMPTFGVEELQRKGRETPRWIHIGPGNIFRCFIARLAQELIEKGEEWPITAVLPMDPEELDLQLGANDLMTLAVTLNPDGSKDQQVVASLAEGLATRREADYRRLREIVDQPQVSLISFTITEKGYMIGAGEQFEKEMLDQLAQADESAPTHTMALVAAILLHRYQNGAAPITLFSFDNFSHNGDKLRDSVLTIAKIWRAAGKVEQGFIDYLEDPAQVGFPVAVIDKITPRPSAEVEKVLNEAGWEDMEVKTLGRTPLAGFVNTEPAEYLVIEKQFASKVPDWEGVGCYVVSKDTCDQFEQMKVTTCLNPLHTALAISGCLLDFPTIDSEMRDKDLAAFVHQLGWKEGLPVVVDPKIVSPQDFLKEVEEVRFPNPYLPDSPYRIAMDTSQKLPIRFGETIKSSIKAGRDLNELEGIALVFALWCRYLLGVKDDGETFNPSSDPRLEEIQAHLKNVKVGDQISAEDAHTVLNPILTDATIFGLDLTSTPLAEKVERFFAELVAEKGAVRRVIHETVTA